MKFKLPGLIRQAPTTDTVTVIKHDTTVKNDTIYPTKPDPTVNLTKGLLLYLPFSGNIADSSGNANATVALGGSVLTYDGHGYANSAFGSNGGGQTVLVTRGDGGLDDRHVSNSVKTAPGTQNTHVSISKIFHT